MNPFNLFKKLLFCTNRKETGYVTIILSIEEINAARLFQKIDRFRGEKRKVYKQIEQKSLPVYKFLSLEIIRISYQYFEEADSKEVILLYRKYLQNEEVFYKKKFKINFQGVHDPLNISH